MKNQKKHFSITTKKGDTGFSKLANLQKIRKDSIYFKVLGDFDELTSFIGFIVVNMRPTFPEFLELLEKIQDDIYIFSAYIAKANVDIDSRFLKSIEKHQKTMEIELEDIIKKRFIKPQGTFLSSIIDITRTITRRTERDFVTLYFEKKQEYDEQKLAYILKFLNRLSDFLYILRYFINHKLQVKEKYN